MEAGEKQVNKEIKAVWNCKAENCDYPRPPTLKGFKQLVGHQKEHVLLPKDKRGYHLIDENTGEVLAQSIKEAKPFLIAETPEVPKKVEPPFLETPPPKKVEPPLLETPPPKEPEPESKVKSPPATKAEEKLVPEELPEEKPKAKGEKDGEITAPQASSDGIFRYTITLPADAFTLFNLAKACGLETDSEKLFDEWLWDCIRMRYKADYKMRLVLAPEEK